MDKEIFVAGQALSAFAVDSHGVRFVDNQRAGFAAKA